MLDLSLQEEDSSYDDEEGPTASEELFFDDNDLDLYERCSDGASPKPLTTKQMQLLSCLDNCRFGKTDKQMTVSV